MQYNKKYHFRIYVTVHGLFFQKKTANIAIAMFAANITMILLNCTSVPGITPCISEPVNEKYFCLTRIIHQSSECRK